MGEIQLMMIVVGILALLLSLTSLKMRLQYRRLGNDDHFMLKLSFWRGLVSYKIEVPVIKTGLKPAFRPGKVPFWARILRPVYKIEATVTGKKDSYPLEKIRKEELLGLKRIFVIMKKSQLIFEKYSPAIRYLLGKVYLRHLQWKTEFGMEEPHVTGFLVGLAGGVKGLLISKFYRVVRTGAARPIVVITPKFEKPCFTTQIECELDIKVGYIFMSGIRLVFTRLKS